MTDADKKVLTEYIGECWHEIVAEQPYEIDGVSVGSLFKCSCGQSFHAPINLHTMINRTLATPADRDAVYSAMVTKEEWKSFIEFASEEWARPQGYVNMNVYDFTAWLFCLNCPEQIPERMKLAAGWIRERG